MDDRILQMEIKLEVKRMMIEDMGQAISELQVDIESGEISEEEIKAKEDKKELHGETEEGTDGSISQKEGTVTELAKKKIKLERQTGIIKEYLIKYRKEMRPKRGTGPGRTSLKQWWWGREEGEKPKSEASIEHYWTPSNILQHHFINHIWYSN